MNNDLKSFKKVLEWLIILELVVFIAPWLVFVPGIENFFSEDFGSFGWIYSMFGIFALAPTLVVYLIVNFLNSKKDNKLKHIDSSNNKEDGQAGVTDSITQGVPLMIATIIFVWWALSLLIG